MSNGDLSWYGPESATFGDRVGGAREAAGMSQGQLARRLGVRKETVAAWENDTSEPRANKLSMMAGLLNVSIVWLLTGEGEGAPGPAESESVASDFDGILHELRELRGTMRASADRAAQVEKRLRTLVSALDEQ